MWPLKYSDVMEKKFFCTHRLSLAGMLVLEHLLIIMAFTFADQFRYVSSLLESENAKGYFRDVFLTFHKMVQFL
jgi:hypothetical protein